MNIRNGGVYLLDLTGNVNPEFGLQHFAVLINTHDRDLYLAFLTTTSQKRITEPFTHVLSVDNSIILFKHTRIVSRQRIISPLRGKGGSLTVVGDQELGVILSEYDAFLHSIGSYAIKSVKQYHQHVEERKKAMCLECHKEISFTVGEKIDYNKMVITSSGGDLSFFPLISSKNEGSAICNVILKNKDGYKIVKSVMVNILPQSYRKTTDK